MFKLRKNKVLFLFFVAMQFLITPLLADTIYVNSSDGIKSINISGRIPTLTETNRIVDWSIEQGFSVSFEVIDFEPVFCPWDLYFIPCRPYSTSEFDECLLQELKEINSGLTERQFHTIKILAQNICYRNSGGY
jgi:hypothetical protein